MLFCHTFHFGITAREILAKLNSPRAVVKADTRDAVEELVMMIDMGFFVLNKSRYRMAIPKRLNVKVLKATALKLALTEDRDFVLHPEALVATIREVSDARN